MLQALIEKLHAWNVSDYAQKKMFHQALKSDDPEVLQWLKDNAMDYLPPYMVDKFVEKVTQKLR